MAVATCAPSNNYAIRYVTIEEFNVDSKAECVQLSRKKCKKEETKTNKRQCPLSSVQVQSRSVKAVRLMIILTQNIICLHFL